MTVTLRATCAVAAATGLLLSGAAASAASKPPAKVCRQILDDAGDGTNVPGGPSNDSLDILSADIATGKKNLVVAVRLKSVARDAALPGGTTHLFRFSAAGTQHDLVYRVFAGGETEATMAVGTSEFPVLGVVDVSTATITWTVPRKLVPGLKRAGTKIGSMSVTSSVGNNVKLGGGGTRGGFNADHAETGRTYTDGTPTCLRGV
jgi:hypothetical protein